MKCVGLFLFVFIHAIHAQTDNYKLIKTIPTTAKHIYTDRLANLYLIENYEIKKFDNEGVFFKSYNFKDIGVLQYFDATNPLKLMLFKPEFNVIRNLDNRMNLQGEINLNQFVQLGLPRLACVSDDGNYWIYDQQNQQLIKVNPSGKVLIVGNSFNQFLNQNINPKQLIAAENWLLLSNNDTSLLVFDRYGNYYRNIQLPHNLNIQVSANQLLFFDGQKLTSIDLNNYKETTISNQIMQQALEVRLELHRIFILKNDSIAIYSF
ncbi:MAG: hypothetical protein JNK61_01030 [Bacteroidia bacterium]|nr:hypothetical protein [Bacteroidia bacterium]